LLGSFEAEPADDRISDPMRLLIHGAWWEKMNFANSSGLVDAPDGSSIE